MLDILYVPFFLGINMSHEGDIMYVGFAEPESYPMVPEIRCKTSETFPLYELPSGNLT